METHDTWAFQTTFCSSSVIFRSPRTRKNTFTVPSNFIFRMNILSLLTRILETKLNRLIVLIDARINDWTIRATLLDCYPRCWIDLSSFWKCLLLPFFPCLWWSSCLIPDWTRPHLNSTPALARTSWLELLIKTSTWLLSWTPSRPAASCKLSVFMEVKNILTDRLIFPLGIKLTNQESRKFVTVDGCELSKLILRDSCQQTQVSDPWSLQFAGSFYWLLAYVELGPLRDIFLPSGT